MPTLRPATPDDASLIAAHRHIMFADNNFASEARFAEMDAVFEPWARAHIANGSYVGLLLQEEGTKEIVAGAGIFFMEFPPHWMHLEARRAYLLNFYTVPEARGKGYAKVLLKACIDLCRERSVEVVTLHASPFGRPIYEKFGFEASTEMMLRLNP